MKVKCKECNNILEYELNDACGTENPVIIVESCKVCLKQAEEDGYVDGYSDGYDECGANEDD